MNKILVVIDMQVDFVSGTLGTKEAIQIVPNVVAKVKQAREEGAFIIATKDTHDAKNYLLSQEGKNLPILHCIKNTAGWELTKELEKLIHPKEIFEKPTFGSLEIMKVVAKMAKGQQVECVEFCGLCTDICVIANVILLKTLAPELKIKVDSRACAGVTPEKHLAALETMKSLQIEID